jgi:hypothetical protein
MLLKPMQPEDTLENPCRVTTNKDRHKLINELVIRTDNQDSRFSLWLVKKQKVNS